MPGYRVALTRSSTYDEPAISQAIERQVDLLGGLDRFVKPGDSVLIKPNLIAPRSHRHATQTHPAPIIALARMLKDFGAKPFVGDSPAWSTAKACAHALRLDEPLKKLGVPIVQLNKPRWRRLGDNGLRVGISAHALDADVIINLPKFKAHQQLVATFAIKNMFGCVTGKRKAIWHLRKGRDVQEFCKLIVEIYKAFSPALTIIDGVYAMDGQGPIHGRTRPLGWLIGGADPVACELICCKLVGMDPLNIPIITAARTLNFGCHSQDSIKLCGDDLSGNICEDFRPANLVPLGFSFPHVCRSIVRQMILLVKSHMAKNDSI